MINSYFRLLNWVGTMLGFKKQIDAVAAENADIRRQQQAHAGYLTRPRVGFSPFELELINTDEHNLPSWWHARARTLKAEYLALQATLS